jgi:hypothetical protein
VYGPPVPPLAVNVVEYAEPVTPFGNAVPVGAVTTSAA